MSQFTATEGSTIAIVSNRGPHDFVWEDGRWMAKSATGGLVSMIEPLARQPNVAWFCCVSEPPESESGRDGLYVTAKDQTDPELNVVPVPLPTSIYHDYYGQISNEVLWMLQHHLVGEFGYSSLEETRHRAWDNYIEANRRMADAIVATEIPISAFLIQDYHLYPLSAMLRKRFPQTPSLHFVHIPFPDPTRLKLLPKHWREAMLQGLLGADVVGMQTPADVRSFLAGCEELLGRTVDYTKKTVALDDRVVRVRAFPASVDPDEVRRVQASPEVAAGRERIAPALKEFNIIRVDRLDPSKNQALGFRAFARLLELHPELRGRVRFLAFLIPSRTDLTVYRDYHDEVYREIERVNSTYTAECGFNPIEVFYTNDRAQAFAALESCDALLVNSREDGMNLVVKEWAILAQKPGVLVVSETAGVASEAGDTALQVSPLDVEGTAQALATALAMPHAERLSRVERLCEGVNKWTARDWLAGQMKELGLTLPEKVQRPVAGPEQETTSPAPAGGEIERELTVLNRAGLHARPAAAFVRCARGFEEDIELLKDGETFSAQSIFGILTANLGCGTKFILRARGPRANEALDKLAELLEEFQRQEG